MTQALLDEAVRRDGADELSCWFSLSYASFLTLPRVLMEGMPDAWQGKMAALLHEYDAAWPGLLQFAYETRVQITKDGKLVKTPEWLINYRRPDHEFVESLRRLTDQQKDETP